MKDYLVKALAFDDQIRAFAISSTNLVEEGTPPSWMLANSICSIRTYINSCCYDGKSIKR